MATQKTTIPFFIRGFILIVLGFGSLLTTDEGINKAALIPGLIITAAGASLAIFAYLAKQNLTKWGWYFVSGLGIMAIGIFILLRPDMVIRVLFVGFGFWFVYQAAMDVMMTKQWKNLPHSNWWQLALSAFLTFLLGVLIMTNPMQGTLRDTMYLGVILIIAGVISFVTGNNLRDKHNKKKVEEL